MDKDTLTLLGRVPFFDALDAGLLEQIGGRLRRRRFAKGVALFHDGDPGQTLYLIVSGRVQIQKLDGTGQIVPIGQCGAGEYFGELALIDGKPRMADAVTTGPCELLMLDRDQFIRCIEANPRIALAVMASLAQRLRVSGEHQVRRRGLDTRGRLAQALLSLAHSYGQPNAEGETQITSPVTHQELADQIGTSRETVSRALAELRRSRALRTQGRFLILLDTDLLRRLSAV